MPKVDAFNHIWPDRFYSALTAVTGTMTDITRRSEAQPMMTRLDERFRIMDLFDAYQQILSLGSPPLELVATAGEAVELARIGTDSLHGRTLRSPPRSLPWICCDVAHVLRNRAHSGSSALCH